MGPPHCQATENDVKKHLFRLLMFTATAAALACSDGLEPVPFQGISGQVTFLGEIPDSTDWVRLVIYRTLPEDSLDLLNFVAFTDTLPLAGLAPPYIMGLGTGDYAWLPVIWKKKDLPLSVESLRVIGWYTAGAAPFDTPVAVTVLEQEETDGINIIGDFGTLLTAAEALDQVR